MPGSVNASNTVPGGVAVTGVIRDTSDPLKRFEPGNPDADAEGYVSYPDINPLTEMVDLMGDAQFRIRGAILDSLRTLDWSPRELRRKGRAVEEAIRSVTQRLGRAPAEHEIAAEMELNLSEFQQLLGDLKGLEIGSLHMERTEDSGDQELAYIPGSPEEDPLFLCLKGELKQRLTDAIDELPERERLVLTLYYFEELTMKEIGLTLGVVESRVSQIHSAAVLRLRVAMAALRTGRGRVPYKGPSSEKGDPRKRGYGTR
jgi:RNA polymerase sigma factor for flagellar operon FliA